MGLYGNLAVGQSLEFVAVKKFRKELGNDDHHNEWTARCELNLFSFGKITTKVFTRSVRVKYVVCSPTKLVLNLIEILSSTVRRSALSLAAKNF